MERNNAIIDNTFFSCIVGSNIYIKNKKDDKSLVYNQEREAVSLLNGPDNEKYYLKSLPVSVLSDNELNRIKRGILSPPKKGTCYWPVDCIKYNEEKSIEIQRKNRNGRDTFEDRSLYALVFTYDNRPIITMKKLLEHIDNADYYCRNVSWRNLDKYIMAFLRQMKTLQNEGYCSPMLSDDDIFFVVDGERIIETVIDSNAILMYGNEAKISPPEELLDYEYLDYYYFVSNPRTLDRFSESHSLAAMLFKMSIGVLPYASFNLGFFNQDQDDLRNWLVNYQSKDNQRFVFCNDYPDANGVGYDIIVNDVVLPKWKGLTSEIREMFCKSLCRDNVLRQNGSPIVYSADEWLNAFKKLYQEADNNES